MKTIHRLLVACTVLALALVAAIGVRATCGGGGGGGAGGAASMGGSMPEQVYRVAWEVLAVGHTQPVEGASLVVRWMPPDNDTIRGSDLLTSRELAMAGERCVRAQVVDPTNLTARQAYNVAPGKQGVVLTDAAGTELARVDPDKKGRISTSLVERMVSKEISAREKAAKDALKVAEAKAKSGDKGAIEELQKIWSARCLYPSLGKKAGKALGKLGVKVSWDELRLLGPDGLPDSDISGERIAVEGLLVSGLKAEIAGSYRVAEGYYREAVDLDPADTTALRYLGEFYRHQTGEWEKAGRIFNQILSQPADRVARAVALHGLGKMTIHAGRFKAGLAMFEKSLAECPLPITYRNLAVYWFSEKQEEKAAGYMRQALALDPDDSYNQIFAAVYLAAAGHKDEAVKIAVANESLLDASYNLAAIWAQVGDRAKAMAMLERHFYAYERYDAVRMMEMKEAREDYMFAGLHGDSKFIELTALAKGAYLVGTEFCAPGSPGYDIIQQTPEMPGATRTKSE